ncbi:hypothetical protein FRC19_004933 [Serendipita sp. 401]|nr:hypothetical protein FRC19_004933 [Serendipita sp. 401]KAG8839148.1 hypothetical protein FRC18_000535 [Serendipita sp. 400]
MSSILSLPDEALLELLCYFSKTSDCLNFASCCRPFLFMKDLRVFWLRIFDCESAVQPMPPLPRPRQDVSVDELKRLVLTTARVDHMLQRESMPEPVRTWNLHIPDGMEILHSDAGPDSLELKSSELPSSDERVQNTPQLWAWLMTDGIHLLSMSKSNIMRLWDMPRKAILTSIDVMGTLACWDYAIDSDGVTLIVNSDDSTTPSEIFRAWRYNWGDESPTLLLRRRLTADARSNFIQGELTGCVMISEDGNAIIYLANWVTLKEMEFNTHLQIPHALSSCTSSKELSLYAEDAEHGLHYAYLLEDLAQYLATYQASPRPPTATTFLIDFEYPTMMDDDLWIPTTRPLSDELIGVFSRVARLDGQVTAQTVTLTVFKAFIGDDSPFDRPGRPFQIRGANRSFIHNIDPPGILTCPESWELSSVGIFARASVWMENSPELRSDGSPLYRALCLVRFPKETTRPVSPSTLRSIDVEVGDGEGLESDLDSYSASSYSEGPPLVASDVESMAPDASAFGPSTNISQPQNLTPLEDLVTTTPMASVTDANNDSSMPTVPKTIGHICEYRFPPDWPEKNGGIYTVDFDDARGRIAFATGNQGILIFDFLD